MKRRTFLNLGSTALLCSGPLAAQEPPMPNLASLGRQCGILIGVTSGKKQLTVGPQAQFITTNFSLLSVGNELKWARVRPDPATFYFGDADWIVDFAQRNAMEFHGHNLCWNTGNPSWFASVLNKSNARDILAAHITTVMKRYAGKVHSWDVVNEPVAVWHKRPDGLYPGPWLDLLGPEYMDIAFHAAAAADPAALRVINIHHVEQDSLDGAASRQVAMTLLTQLVKRGVPIQAVGFESHLDGALSAQSSSRDRFIKSIRDLGLKFMITELEINDTKMTGDLAARDHNIAELYQGYIESVAAAGSVKALIFYGITDAGAWFDATPGFARADNAKHRPALLDENMQAKPALFSAAAALKSLCSTSQ